MKTCPYCGKQYNDNMAHCVIDRNELIDSAQASRNVNRGWRSLFSSGIPKHPLNEEQKTWIESSFQWLLGEFGVDYFLGRKTILPNLDFFPDPYQGTEACVDKLLVRVCSYMDVDFRLIEVEFFADRNDIAARHRTGNEDAYSGAAGLYFSGKTHENRRKIAINISQLKNPTGLVATIAHELGHVVLLGGGKITRDREDHEYLTDLLTVFFGLGIFTANSIFQFSQWQDHSHHGWSASRTGYLTEEMFAYSLAAYAWMRGESNPSWSKLLNMNVGHYFKQSLKFFTMGGQTSLYQLVQPDK